MHIWARSHLPRGLEGHVSARKKDPGARQARSGHNKRITKIGLQPGVVPVPLRKLSYQSWLHIRCRTTENQKHLVSERHKYNIQTIDNLVWLVLFLFCRFFWRPSPACPSLQLSWPLLSAKKSWKQGSTLGANDGNPINLFQTAKSRWLLIASWLPCLLRPAPRPELTKF